MISSGSGRIGTDLSTVPPLDLARSAFSSSFLAALLKEHEMLTSMLRNGAFVSMPHGLAGLELELFLIDPQSLEPVPRAAELLGSTRDATLSGELGLFQLESSSAPASLSGSFFRDWELQAVATLAGIDAQATASGACSFLGGMLPTMLLEHVQGLGNATRHPLVSQINSALIRQKEGGGFRASFAAIDGASVFVESDSNLIAALGCGLQPNLSLPFSELVLGLKTATLISPLVLALSCNSLLVPQAHGTTIGWKESRVPILEQSHEIVNSEGSKPLRRWFFSSGFATDIESHFAQALALPPLFEQQLESAAHFDFPNFTAHWKRVWQMVRLRAGSIEDRPALRIEHRVVPTQPTPLENAAVAALFAGLLRGLLSRLRAEPNLEQCLFGDFSQVERDFYSCAQFGLEAKIKFGERRAKAFELAHELLPLAREGLMELGIEQSDTERLLGVIERRIAARVSPSDICLKWLRRHLDPLAPGMPIPPELLREFTRLSLARQRANLPLTDLRL